MGWEPLINIHPKFSHLQNIKKYIFFNSRSLFYYLTMILKLKKIKWESACAVDLKSATERQGSRICYISTEIMVRKKCIIEFALLAWNTGSILWLTKHADV